MLAGSRWTGWLLAKASKRARIDSALCGVRSVSYRFKAQTNRPSDGTDVRAVVDLGHGGKVLPKTSVQSSKGTSRPMLLRYSKESAVVLAGL